MPDTEDYEKIIKEAKYHSDIGNIETAIDLLKKASILAQRIGDTITQAAILNNLGLYQKRAGQTNIAYETLTQSVQLLKPIQFQLAEALRNLGFIERDLGNLESAIQHHKTALTLYELMNDNVGMARTLIDLGLEYKDQTKLTEARTNLEHAISLLSTDTISLMAHAWIGLGLILEKLHDTKGAIDYYLKALQAYRQANDRENEAVALHNIGRAYDNQKNFQAALDYYRQSLEINIEINSRWGKLENLTSLAAIYQLTGDPHQARHMHEQLLLLQKETGDLRGQIWTLCDLAIIARDAGHLDEAELNLIQALKIAQRMKDPQEIYEIYFNLGDIQMLLDKPDKAADDYKAAAEATESLRSRLLTEKETLDYFNEPNIEVYDRLVRLYTCVLNDPKQALVWEERSKTREFLRRLGLHEIARPQQVPKYLIDREEQLLAQLNEIAVSLSFDDNNKTNHVEKLSEYEKVESNLNALWTKIEAIDPEYTSLRSGQPIEWKTIRQLLGSI